MKTGICAVLLLAFSLPVFADEYDNRYGQAINLLYQQNKPQEAFDIFADLERQEPNRSWATPFMCGYALRIYLKKPAESLPYFVRSRALVKGENEDPYKNAIQAREEMGDYAGALRESDFALRDLASHGKTPSAWFPENRAWVLMQLGRPDEALKHAPAGSWVEQQLAPREIRIEWRLNFTKMMSQYNLTNEKTVRLSMPLERMYQKVLRREADVPQGISHSYPVRDGNRYLELTRSEGVDWPETLTLKFLIRQDPAKGSSNLRLAAAKPGSKLWHYATDNNDGVFSLDNPEFIAKVESITSSGKNTTEKAKLALAYLQKNFRYGEKPNLAKWNAHDALNFGSGDCGYYSFISIAMLRALKIPVRGVYGLNQWKDPAPALPHAIIEIYDSGTNQWLPFEPQSNKFTAYINTNYVPFFTPNPMQWTVWRNPEGVVEVDTTYFFWSGSGADTLVYDIKPLAKGGELAFGKSDGSRSVPGAAAQPTFVPNVAQPRVSSGPLPK